jgi:hypothetical protein
VVFDPRDRDSLHLQVTRALSGYEHRDSDVQRTIRSIGRLLGQARRTREIADYKIEQDFSIEEAVATLGIVGELVLRVSSIARQVP